MNYDYLNGKNPNCNAKALKMLYCDDVHCTPRCRAIDFLISETKVSRIWETIAQTIWRSGSEPHFAICGLGVTSGLEQIALLRGTSTSPSS